jgi:hypothetical protein
MADNGKPTLTPSARGYYWVCEGYGISRVGRTTPEAFANWQEGLRIKTELGRLRRLNALSEEAMQEAIKDRPYADARRRGQVNNDETEDLVATTSEEIAVREQWVIDNVHASRCEVEYITQTAKMALCFALGLRVQKLMVDHGFSNTEALHRAFAAECTSLEKRGIAVDDALSAEIGDVQTEGATHG